jgi:hypothetical protein
MNDVLSHYLMDDMRREVYGHLSVLELVALCCVNKFYHINTPQHVTAWRTDSDTGRQHFGARLLSRVPHCSITYYEVTVPAYLRYDLQYSEDVKRRLHPTAVTAVLGTTLITEWGSHRHCIMPLTQGTRAYRLAVSASTSFDADSVLRDMLPNRLDKNNHEYQLHTLRFSGFKMEDFGDESSLPTQLLRVLRPRCPKLVHIYVDECTFMHRKDDHHILDSKSLQFFEELLAPEMGPSFYLHGYFKDISDHNSEYIGLDDWLNYAPRTFMASTSAVYVPGSDSRVAPGGFTSARAAEMLYNFTYRECFNNFTLAKRVDALFMERLFSKTQLRLCTKRWPICLGSFLLMSPSALDVMMYRTRSEFLEMRRRRRHRGVSTQSYDMDVVHYRLRWLRIIVHAFHRERLAFNEHPKAQLLSEKLTRFLLALSDDFKDTFWQVMAALLRFDPVHKSSEMIPCVNMRLEQFLRCYYAPYPSAITDRPAEASGLWYIYQDIKELAANAPLVHYGCVLESGVVLAADILYHLGGRWWKGNAETSTALLRICEAISQFCTRLGQRRSTAIAETFSRRLARDLFVVRPQIVAQDPRCSASDMFSVLSTWVSMPHLLKCRVPHEYLLSDYVIADALHRDPSGQSLHATWEKYTSALQAGHDNNNNNDVSSIVVAALCDRRVKEYRHGEKGLVDCTLPLTTHHKDDDDDDFAAGRPDPLETPSAWGVTRTKNLLQFTEQTQKSDKKSEFASMRALANAGAERGPNGGGVRTRGRRGHLNITSSAQYFENILDNL